MNLQSLPDHIRRPHLRPVHPIPVRKDGKQFVALRDPLLTGRQSMVVAPQIMPILQQFRGDADLDALAERFKIEIEKFVQLAEGLDRIGLLWGPTFEQLEQELRDKLFAEGAFPTRVSASLGDDEAACRSAIEEYLDQTEDPELDTPVVGIVAPHLDYARGWPNYAAAYRCLDGMEAPDRVVILGTNHFGLGDGIVMTELGFDTPLGRCRTDEAVISSVVERLGKRAIVDQLDHLPEHSIELQLPWLQHAFGDVPIVAALIPDPLAPMIEEDEARVETEEFIDALGQALGEAGGSSFFVASSDLSHVGPQFGEPRSVDEQRRIDVERHDREMLGKFLGGDAEEFLSAMRWNKNPTRWCSIGNMAATLMLADYDELELIDYRQAFDENGGAMVSSAAIALVGAGAAP